jgi:DNA-binding transcriptional LysR family regulator
MNESQLETFLTVSEYKSYSKAADALNVTQPTVTSRIKSLEDILKCELFTRTGHEISLTEEGIIFTEYAKNILININHSKEIKNMVKAPVIKVGFSPGYSYSFIIELLKAVKSIGNIDVQVADGYDSVSLNEKVLLGEVDLVFTRDMLPNSPYITSEYLFDNNLVVVLPIDHQLCKKHPLTIEDLNGETILSYKRNSELWKSIDHKLISAHDITRIEVENNEMLLNAVANELGIGIIPELGIDKKYKSSIVIKKIKTLTNIQNKVYVQYRINSQIEKLAKKIIYSVINHKYSGE